MTASAYLTPKPCHHAYTLPTCPPPPRPAHETIDVHSNDGGAASFPALRTSSNSTSTSLLMNDDDPRGSFFFLPIVTATKLGETNNVRMSAKRSRDGGNGVLLRPSLSIRLQPRPSKYAPPMRRRPLASFGGAGNNNRGDLPTLLPALPLRRRRSSATLLPKSTTLARSSSHQYLLSMTAKNANGGGKKAKGSLVRRPSFSRAA